MGFEAAEVPHEASEAAYAPAAPDAAFSGVSDTVITVPGERVAGSGEEAGYGGGDAAGAAVTEAPGGDGDTSAQHWGRDQPRAILRELAAAGFDVTPAFGKDKQKAQQVFGLLVTDMKATDIAARTGVDPTVITKMARRWVRYAEQYAAAHPMPEDLPADLFVRRGRQPGEVVQSERADELRRALGRTGLRARELAAELGISTAYMSRILSGQRPPTRQVVDRLVGHGPEEEWDAHEHRYRIPEPDEHRTEP